MKNKILTKETFSDLGCLFLFFAPFAAVGLFTMYLSVHGIYKSQVSKYWNKTIGSVEKIKYETSSDGDSQKILISYSYKWENKTYRGENIGFGYGMNNIDAHSAIFEKLRYSKKINIYVNPRNIEESVVTTGLNDSLIGISIFALMWNSFIGILIIPMFFQNKPKLENEIFKVTNPSDD